jgi:hypothetical protein
MLSPCLPSRKLLSPAERLALVGRPRRRAVHRPKRAVHSVFLPRTRTSRAAVRSARRDEMDLKSANIFQLSHPGDLRKYRLNFETALT